MKNKIILAVLILSIIVLIFSGCGGTSNPVVPPLETTEDEDLFLAKVVDSQSDIQFIAEKDDEVLAFLAEKDIQGNPIEIRGAAYLSDDDELLIIIAGENGLPETIIDSKGNRIEFTNYTNLTAEVYWYDEQDELIQDPITIDIDEQDLLELQQIYFDFNSKSAKGKTNNIIRWGILGIEGVVCVGGFYLSGPNPPVLRVCGSVALGTVAALTENKIDDAASFTVGGASCLGGGDPLSCLSTLNNVVDVIFSAHNHPPTPLFPGSSSAPGKIIYTLTPTLAWAEADNADYYDVAIKEYPYNTNIFLDFQKIYENFFVVPTERLEEWKKYCWSVRAHNNDGFSNYSEALYFQIENVPSEIITIATITASAGPNGSISPSGDIIVNYGLDKTFTISPDTGYQIDDVLVDGNSIGAKNSYTFINITESHTISTTFKSIENIVLNSITVSPSTMSLAEGGSQTISSITAHYSDGSTADIALNACTYDSNNTGVATVDAGLITIVDEGTTTITINYTEEGISKTDTVEVMVTSTVTNQPPSIPNNPSPTSGSTSISINTNLGWTGGDPNPEDTVTYDVYFEANDSTPDILVSNDQSNITYDPGILNYNTHYYWKIIAKDNHSQEVSGSIWDFTTEDQSSILSFTSLTPVTVSTSDSTHTEPFSAMGKNFNNVNQIIVSWSGPDSGSRVWNKGDSNWNAKVTVNSDTRMTLLIKVLSNETGTQTKTWTWIVTLKDNTGATVSKSFTVTYTPPNVTLTLYIHENSTSGPPLSGVSIGVVDGGGNPFNKTTNSSGYITITGIPGTWYFSASKSGYDTNSWNQSITTNCTRYGYIVKSTPSLTFTGLTPSQIPTSTSPYQATLSATGSNFNNVNRISFNWHGAANDSATWDKGDANWNAKVTINSDNSMTLNPGVIEANPTWSGTAYWTVTLRDDTGKTASKSFTVTYTPPNVTLTLYIHENSTSGPPLSGVSIGVVDGGGNPFNKTTNSSGYITITGIPGAWYFSASKSGYDTNSWNQSITTNCTRYGYIVKSVTPVGAIDVFAKLDGSGWYGSLGYSLTGSSSLSGSTVPAILSNKPIGSYSITFNSGGPSNAFLSSITPNSTQTLSTGGIIAFTFNFTTKAP